MVFSKILPNWDTVLYTCTIFSKQSTIPINAVADKDFNLVVLKHEDGELIMIQRFKSFYGLEDTQRDSNSVANCIFEGNWG